MSRRASLVLSRLLLIDFSLGVVLADAMWAWQLTRASSQIHRFYDTDNEAGLSQWGFNFKGVQFTAASVALGFVCGAGALTFLARRIGRPPPPGRALAAVVIASVFLNVGIVLSIRHAADIARTMSGDPSGSMQLSTAFLVAQAVVAALAFAFVVVGRPTWRDPATLVEQLERRP